MNRTNRILPTYTGDVSGACSALFELGGMVVIHDPSGCNSTYNTHDETRWYDHDSLIFITGLIERDAVLGNDQKLVDDVVDAAFTLSPAFIALCNSPIPFISGTDFAALCKLIEKRCNIPCFYVPTNGMHDYTVGAGNALAAIARRFVKPAEARAHTANILGVTPLDYNAPGAADSLRAFAEEAGFDVVSAWAMDSSLDDLARAAEAEVNLVVSATGMAAAQELRRRFGTPYVVGTPVGTNFSRRLAAALRNAATNGACALPCRDGRSESDTTTCVIAEPVTAASLASALEADCALLTRVICPLESDAGVLLPSDCKVFGEEEAQAAASTSRLLIADPLYAPICGPTTRLVPLPHQAFSGRNSWQGARNLTAIDVGDFVTDV